jgi:putative endonuclease
MPHFVYILECSDKTLYVGYTTNLEARHQQHSDGRGGRYTSIRLPVRLVYSERCNSGAAALKRERQITRWTRAKKEALVARDCELLKRLSPTRRRGGASALPIDNLQTEKRTRKRLVAAV